MADPNLYVRSDDIAMLMAAEIAAIDADVAQLTVELAGIGADEVGPLRKVYLAGEIMKGHAQAEAIRTLARSLQRADRYRYRSFTNYDGVTKFNSLVTATADRVPLDPEVFDTSKGMTGEATV